MIKSCADKITSFLICSNTIDKDEEKIYSYGFEVMIAFIVNIVVILSIGCYLDLFLETILFLICYCSIRQFAGGYHAESYRNCLFVFIVLYLSNSFIVERLIYNKLQYLIMGFALISYIGISIISPLEHRNNPLSKNERKKYKNIVIYWTGLIFFCTTIASICFGRNRCLMYILSSINCIFIMQLLGIINKNIKGGGKKYGQNC